MVHLFYKNRLVLVTGGAGFIGSHIAEQLVSLGAHVTILDDLSTGNTDNLKGIRNNITFIHGTITDFATCLETTKHKDIIFHLAAAVSVPQSVAQPRACYETNVLGTINLLEAARINSISRFIFSSSSAVYGSHEGICAETTPCKPESPYGLSKLMGEQLCQQYARLFNIDTVSLRYFNVFGPRQNPQGIYAAVVAKFQDCMQHNKPIIIFGDGSQRRDFIPVQQVVDTNVQVGAIAHLTPGEIYNVATGTSITLLELLEQLKQKFPNFTAGYTFAPARSGDIRYSYADCTKYRQILQHYS